MLIIFTGGGGGTPRKLGKCNDENKLDLRENMRGAGETCRRKTFTYEYFFKKLVLALTRFDRAVKGYSKMA